MPSRMTKEPLKRTVTRKPRAKKTEAKPATVYKAPGARPGFLGTMLDTVSRGTLVIMEGHSRARGQKQKEELLGGLQGIVISPEVQRLAVRP